jgi:transglutaminase-like putative cysteine protease
MNTSPSPIPSECLSATAFIDSDHPAVIDYATQAVGDARTDIDKAIGLYYAVRDDIRYDPYAIDLSPSGMRASTVLETGRGWCVNKAALLAAVCRVMGIPAALGFADVRNHLSTERLREAMGTDIFHYHGYTAIFLNGQWLKATPAFNLSLCEKMRLQPLEFDGSEDSIYHPFDLSGNRHMEYVAFRGERADLPLDELLQAFDVYYPNMARLDTADFDADVAREIRNPPSH